MGNYGQVIFCSLLPFPLVKTWEFMPWKTAEAGSWQQMTWKPLLGKKSEVTPREPLSLGVSPECLQSIFSPFCLCEKHGQSPWEGQGEPGRDLCGHWEALTVFFGLTWGRWRRINSVFAWLSWGLVGGRFLGQARTTHSEQQYYLMLEKSSL